MPPKSSRFRGVTLFKPTGKWRAQISAGGKTTSLGDHESEEGAARAFDRAAINKAGRAAILNFPLEEYEAELEELQRMALPDLVATLRNKARRHGAQTSSFRGVSLLRQTGKWHAQINVAGRQLHLGFFASEEAAARAYDRAAIHKAGPGGSSATAAVSSAAVATTTMMLGVAAPFSPPPPPPTNFPLAEYEGEVAMLQALSQAELLALLSERKGGGGVGGGSDRGGGSSGEGGSGLQAPHTATLGGSRRGSASKRRSPDDGGSDGSGGSAAGLAPGLPDIFPRGKGRRTRLRPCRAPAA